MSSSGHGKPLDKKKSPIFKSEQRGTPRLWVLKINACLRVSHPVLSASPPSSKGLLEGSRSAGARAGGGVTLPCPPLPGPGGRFWALPGPRAQRAGRGCPFPTGGVAAEGAEAAAIPLVTSRKGAGTTPGPSCDTHTTPHPPPAPNPLLFTPNTTAGAGTPGAGRGGAVETRPAQGRPGTGAQTHTHTHPPGVRGAPEARPAAAGSPGPVRRVPVPVPVRWVPVPAPARALPPPPPRAGNMTSCSALPIGLRRRRLTLAIGPRRCHSFPRSPPLRRHAAHLLHTLSTLPARRSDWPARL